MYLECLGGNWIKRRSGFSSELLFFAWFICMFCLKCWCDRKWGVYDWLIFHGLCHNFKKEVVIVENQLLTSFACINKLDDLVERHLWLQSGYDIGHVMNGKESSYSGTPKKVACLLFTVYSQTALKSKLAFNYLDDNECTSKSTSGCLDFCHGQIDSSANEQFFMEDIILVPSV